MAAPTAFYEIFKGQDTNFWWRFKASNGIEICRSSEGYKSKEHCKESITLVKSSKDAPIKDLT
jgi:uncharacterized protein YegP (UPF0339 family)